MTIPLQRSCYYNIYRQASDTTGYEYCVFLYWIIELVKKRNVRCKNVHTANKSITNQITVLFYVIKILIVLILF